MSQEEHNTQSASAVKQMCSIIASEIAREGPYQKYNENFPCIWSVGLLFPCTAKTLLGLLMQLSDQ